MTSPRRGPLIITLTCCLLGDRAEGRRMMMESLNADAVLEVEAKTNATAASCRWDEAKCCCDVSNVKGNTVVTCKQFTTGIKDGKEVCRCKDVGKEAFGFAGTPHSPNSWKLNWWLFGNDQAMQELQAQCADPSLPFAFHGDRPEGSCTVDRLFSYGTPRWMQGTRCESEKKSTAIQLEEKLASFKLLNSINPLLTRGALMGCAAIGEGCAKLSWTNSIMQKVLSNLDSGLGLGQLARDQILLYATDALVNEAGVDEETAGLLIDWAFHHEEGTNAYCDPELMAQHRDMRVKGLTAGEPNHTVLERPWVYGEEDVYKPFRDLLSFTVEGMFKADCEKPRPPEVQYYRAKCLVALGFLEEATRAALEALNLGDGAPWKDDVMRILIDLLLADNRESEREKDLYEVLGVPRTASLAEIKRAYRQLAMRYHPDKNPGDPMAEKLFIELSEAYQVLSDPDLRARYDSGEAGTSLRREAGSRGGAGRAGSASGGGAGANAGAGGGEDVEGALRVFHQSSAAPAGTAGGSGGLRGARRVAEGLEREEDGVDDDWDGRVPAHCCLPGPV